MRCRHSETFPVPGIGLYWRALGPPIAARRRGPGMVTRPRIAWFLPKTIRRYSCTGFRRPRTIPGWPARRRTAEGLPLRRRTVRLALRTIAEMFSVWRRTIGLALRAITKRLGV